ncbi:MAG: VCBS repeat-containing protein [Bacteroidales bacterium]|nr:VCBS repeat-containing protein [Bacteroidales bacterium]
MKHVFAFFTLFMIARLLTAQISFTKVTEGAIVNDGGWNYGMCWADFNMDELPDLFVVNNDANNGKLNFLYLNNGDGTFTKVTEGEVVNDGGSSYACTVADVTGDGYSDLFVANHNENNFLYFGNGDGTFEKVTTGPVVTDGGKSVGCAWADYDQDGWLDLYVVNRDQPNFLYHGTGLGSFEKITTGSIVTDVANSSGCAWGDYDNDGRPDLYVANSGSESNLYHNNGSTFTKVEEEPFVSDVSSCSGASWGDCDNDGDLDLFVSTGQLGTYVNWFYLNNGDGSFTKVTDSPLVNEVNWASGSAWGDYDKDGDLDLAVGGYDGNNLLFENDGSGNFTKITGNAFVNDGNYTEGLAWADADDDGDLDIFTAKNNYFGGNNSFFLNEGNDNNWLKVRLWAAGNLDGYNTLAIGARVEAWATIDGEQVMQMREVSSQTGGGQGGLNELIQFFGLGDASMMDSIYVTFMGWTFKNYNIEANQTYLFDLTTVGIPEMNSPEKAQLSAYPNPATDWVKIKLNGISEITSLQITDLQGKIILEINTDDLNQNEFIWNLEDRDGNRVKPGVHFVRIISGKGMYAEKLIIR